MSIAFKHMHSRLLETLRDAQHEARRLNGVYMETVFSPAVLALIAEGIEDLEQVEAQTRDRECDKDAERAEAEGHPLVDDGLF